MKKILFTLMLTMLASTIFAQMSGYGYMPNIAVAKYKLQPGGPNGKSYAIIAVTNGNKQTLIDSTVAFVMRNGLGKSLADIENAVKEFSESSSQFSIRMSHLMGFWKSGMYYGDPVMMGYDMRFEFYENGNVMVVFDNFSSTNYVDLSNIDKRYDTCAVYDAKDKAKIWEYRNAQTTIFTGKADAIASSILGDKAGAKDAANRYQKTMELRYDVKGFYELLDRTVVNCPNKFWATDETVLKYVEEAVNNNTFKGVGGKSVVDYLKKSLEEGRMFSVPYVLWKTNIKENFDRYMIWIQNSLGAKIIGVAEDGEQTWEDVDGVLLPKDAKLRDKLIKKKMDYFSYVENL